MGIYILRRILYGIPVLLAIITVTFALSHALPGGPFDSNNQRRLPPHIRAQLEQKFGLQKPVFFNLPGDGKGSETAWGKTLTVKGHSDTNYVTQTFAAPANAGIKLYGEYNLIDNGETLCTGQRIEPGWALIARRQECIVTGGDLNQTFAEVRTRWAIDLLDSQYWTYLGNVIRLDFGPSLDLAKVQENRQVTDDIKERVPISLQLGIFSTLLGFLLGIPIGILGAVYHNSVVDYTTTFFTVLGQSIPTIVLAPMLILFFAVRLQWVPAADAPIWREGSSFVLPYVGTLLLTLLAIILLLRFLPHRWSTESAVLLPLVIPIVLLLAALFFWIGLIRDLPENQSQLGRYVKALILPVGTVGVGMSTGIARLTRAMMLQVLREDYIQTARAKGLPERMVLYVHALKNALIPVVTALGPLLAGIVTGSFIIEQIFSIPGMGASLVTAVGARDYTTIMGVTIFYSTILIMGNILVDIMYTWLDPRIRLG